MDCERELAAQGLCPGRQFLRQSEGRSTDETYSITGAMLPIAELATPAMV